MRISRWELNTGCGEGTSLLTPYSGGVGTYAGTEGGMGVRRHHHRHSITATTTIITMPSLYACIIDQAASPT